MKRNPLTRGAAFTLIELLVSMAILAMIVMIMVSMVSQTTSIWSKTTGKVEQFRSAREGYEAMTRRLGQATLNTYWDYDNPATPKKYIRKSELRFLSGRELIDASGAGTYRPTYGVYFFAPLGFVDKAGATTAANDKYRGLDNVLNTCGYFIQYGGDSEWKPSFVKTPDRKRFRLMEIFVPSQDLHKKLFTDPTWDTTGSNNAWIFGEPYSATAVGWSYTSDRMHVLGENIVAMLVLPKLSKADIQKYNATGSKTYDDYSLAPGYSYSSTAVWTDARKKDPRLNPINQIPPVVQVVMVAIDEASATRMSDADNLALLAKLHTLFTDSTKMEKELYGDPNNPSKSEATDSLIEYLVRKRINYRVFNSDVAIRAAKWSSEQTN